MFLNNEIMTFVTILAFIVCTFSVVFLIIISIKILIAKSNKNTINEWINKELLLHKIEKLYNTNKTVNKENVINMINEQRGITVQNIKKHGIGIVKYSDIISRFYIKRLHDMFKQIMPEKTFLFIPMDLNIDNCSKSNLIALRDYINTILNKIK